MASRTATYTIFAVILLLVLLAISGLQLNQTLEVKKAESDAAQSTQQALAAIESEIKGYIDTAVARERTENGEALSEERLAEQVLARLQQLIANGELIVARPEPQPEPQPETEPAPMASASDETADTGTSAIGIAALPAPPPGTEFAAVEPASEVVAKPSGEVKIDQIHFLLDSTELTPGAHRKVMAAADQIRKAAPREVRIIGFADTVGPAEYNEVLSVNRAQSVADLLMRAGVPVQQVEVSGLGESVLPEPTGDGVEEPLNRCVSIRMVY